MRLLFPLLLLVLISIQFTSCSKMGPEGPVGPPGPSGPLGNANVRSYIFSTPRTFSNGTCTVTIPNLTKAFVDSSIILPYYEVSSVWYLLPGIGVDSKYETRYILTQDNSSPSIYKINIYLYELGTSVPYSDSVTWDRLKIIFVPANVITIID